MRRTVPCDNAPSRRVATDAGAVAIELSYSISLICTGARRNLTAYGTTHGKLKKIFALLLTACGDWVVFVAATRHPGRCNRRCGPKRLPDMAHIRQSRPQSGLGFQVKALETIHFRWETSEA